MNLNGQLGRAMNRSLTSLAAIAAVSAIFGAKALEHAANAEALDGPHTVNAPLTLSRTG